MEEVESFFRFGPFSLSLSLSLFLSPPPLLLFSSFFGLLYLGFSPFSSFVNLELEICNLAVAIIPHPSHTCLSFYFVYFYYYFFTLSFFKIKI